MPLESVGYVSDLDADNPEGTDSRKQGDDHLRLIKFALKSTFPNASREFYFPVCVDVVADLTIDETYQNTVLVVDTTAGDITIFLPEDGVTTSGWAVYVARVLGAPEHLWVHGGNVGINGYTYVRRAVPGLTRVVWTGSTYVAQRSVGVPVGSLIQHEAVLAPAGWLLADGSIFSAVNYPELAVVYPGQILPTVSGHIVAAE